MSVKHSSWLLCCLGLVCLVAWAQGRSVSMIGDVLINISDDKFICDKIECPLTTDYCVVTKEKDPKDAAVLVRSNFCYSAAQEVLTQQVTREKINPNGQLKVHITAHRNGMVSSVNSQDSFTMGNFNASALEQELSKLEQNINAEMTKLQHDLQVNLQNIL